jgi:hypothetical protein
MASSDITVKMDKDFVELFRSTRVIRCLAWSCKNNLMNDGGSQQPECRLKHVYIINDGKCEQFEQKAVDNG